MIITNYPRLLHGLLLIFALAQPGAVAQDIAFERVQLSDQFYSEGGTYGDFDADGAGDVAVGPWIYFGPEFESKTRFYAGDALDPVGYSENFLMYSDDVNADGRLDVIVIGFPGKASWWYENPAVSQASSPEAESTWKQHVILDSVDNESPLIADVDGDGVRDLICCNAGRFVVASHAGQSPELPWKVKAITPNNGYQRFTHGVGIGDVNNDGQIDLIEKDGWWENPGPAAADDATWTQHPFPFAAAGAQMYAVDFDGDGKNEILTCEHAHGFGLVYFKAINPQATDFEKIEIMTDAVATSPTGVAISQLHAVDIADVNQDGVLDIVTGKRWWAHKNGDVSSEQPATLLWFETQRQAGRVKFVPHVVDNSSGVGTQVTAADVNGDGLVDIVSGNKRGAYVFLQRPHNLAAGELLVPGLAKVDPFGQQLATDSLAVGDAMVPALGQRKLNLDFESGSLADWEIRGTISGKLLHKSGADSDASLGSYSVDTLAGNPQAIGELISRPFLLPAATFCFAAGGQPDAQTRIELVLEQSGQPIAVWPAEASNQADRPATAMVDVALDVANYRGQAVRIRVVDHSNSGYIQADAFQFK